MPRNVHGDLLGFGLHVRHTETDVTHRRTHTAPAIVPDIPIRDSRLLGQAPHPHAVVLLETQGRAQVVVQVALHPLGQVNQLMSKSYAHLLTTICQFLRNYCFTAEYNSVFYKSCCAINDQLLRL